MLAQDLPFFILGTVLLIRTVDRKDDVTVLAANRFCSVQYDTGSYVLLVLNTMKTAGMLATKLIKVKQLPGMLSKRQALHAEKAKLAQRLVQLEHVEMAAVAATAPDTALAINDARADSLLDAAPNASDTDTLTPHPQVAIPSDAPAGSAPLERRYTVSLSVRLSECASEWTACVCYASRRAPGC